VTVAFDSVAHSSALGFEGESRGQWFEKRVVAMVGEGRISESDGYGSFILLYARCRNSGHYVLLLSPW
jgi:hypothetical protein